MPSIQGAAILLIHLHLDVMVTVGGLDGQGRWCEPRKNGLLPRQVLMQVFRDRELDEGGGGGGRR